ncbi:hypothetical protein AAFC00_004028 [Neodothiora populina]|uniref:DNA/RNA-binding domain-containing protein n=1 Tax=Neodothiora populina TaxID=2781224 RepID=A0ABR3PIB4_9PEZI
MAIEDGNQRDRDIWGEVARSWYSTASDISPDTGRLYHHLGILARPNAVEQLSLYCRSLICVSPFQNAHESLSNLLTSALSPEKAGRTVLCIHELDATFIHIHAAMYTQLAQKAEKSVSFEDVYEKQGMYIAGLAGQIDYLGERWKKHGVCIAIANIAACLGYGDEGTDNPILAALTSLSDATESVQLSDSDWSSLMQATGLLFSVLAVALSRKADFTVLPHVHVLLVFIRGVVSLSFGSAPYLQTFVDLVPWLELGAFLNSFPRPDTISEDVLDAADLRAVERRACPLFEDYSLRGAVWGRNYLAEKWFTNSSDDSTGEVEELSANDTRLQRVLWLGVSISKRVNHLRFNADSMTFIDGHRYSQ